MELIVLRNGEEYRVVIEQHGHSTTVRVGDETYDVDTVATVGSVRSMIIAGRQFEVSVKRSNANSYQVCYFGSVEDVEVLDPMPGHTGFWAGWLIGSMHTQKGELWTRDAFIFDPVDFYLSAENATAIGGTGVYEGATGGFVFLGTDDSGIIRGVICTQ